ncbi:MAG: recombination protein RecR [Armatimonadetes bacterium]|nr:recombination protein RecR [Armatimonadota bacterium]PIU65229.1 MAG: recombination protein RecR [Armatimonadetes bacterium CG07_land_8_20_14_0_80_59_28]PIX42187.1 MAG: recombination protein RecR [Armatimonadetes bacterium CG_4_8_14_3_um_filter_58_9]PIY42650.1 MAG: recombination protein RecR [Armatimonadetes bacterium CG_4_10_14_3_um_filter_59_10]PJB62311.1 MAG: recombination protein RecR [Armatimonadetes bacterium CG_4_9_14_3_um_filter_58_7]
MLYPRPIARLLEELEKLPGIGPKSAQRIAYHILREPPNFAEKLSQAVVDTRAKIRDCSRCFSLSEGELCPICQDDRRDRASLCVVAEPRDLMAVENTGTYRGCYHVLQGHLSPIDGIGPDDLRIDPLIQRVREGAISEVILATNPTVEGDATALYIAELLRPFPVRVTQLAMGLPVGGDLDYADQVTIARAFEGRRLM